MTADEALSVLTEAFAPGRPSRLGVAVSGGSDSLALLHVAADWARRDGPEVLAVTVDHRLRPEAAAEAAMVAGVCEGLGVAHRTLAWDHGTLSGNRQDAARRARYRLIGNWARDAGVSHVAIGHTANDQAETVLMGLARAAGIDGLAGMRRRWTDGEVEWVRPFLGVTRQALRDVLAARGAGWVEDPTNEDDRYARVRARRALAALAPLGVSVAGLAAVADNLAQARQVVVEATAGAAERIARESCGEVILDREAFLRLAPEVTRRLLAAALRWISGAEHAPRADAVQRLKAAVRDRRDATLWGCRMVVRGNEVRLVREPKAVAGLEAPVSGLWDGRWRLSGPRSGGLVVRALGAEGLRQCAGWRETGHSRAALVVSPAVWRGDALVAAPLAGPGRGWAAEIVAGFHSFLLSH